MDKRGGRGPQPSAQPIGMIAWQARAAALLNVIKETCDARRDAEPGLDEDGGFYRRRGRCTVVGLEGTVPWLTIEPTWMAS